MAAPLAKQPADHLRTIASFLPTGSLAHLAQQSSALQEQVRPLLETKRLQQLQLQQLQWSLLLKSFDSVQQNEDLLRAYQVGIVSLSAEEEEAWRVAFNSLHSPPPPLTAEERTALAQQYLPRYYEYVVSRQAAGPLPPLPANLREEEYYRWSRTSLSEIALYDADFLSFLRIFAVDGNRFEGGIVEAAFQTAIWPFAQISAPEVLALPQIRYARPTQGQAADYRGIMAALLCIRGTPNVESLYSWSITSFHPALVQARLDAGVDFFEGRARRRQYDHRGIQTTHTTGLPNTCLFLQALQYKSPFVIRLILDTATPDAETQKWISQGASELELEWTAMRARGVSSQSLIDCARVLVQYRYQVDLPALQSLQRTLHLS